MLEIFAFPYFVVSGVIGWLIFKPFFRSAEFEPLSPAKVTIADLMAISFPSGVLFAFTAWLMPPAMRSPSIQFMVVTFAMLFAVTSLWVGVLLAPSMFQNAFAKRMILVGVISPFGILLMIGWVGLLIWSGSYSILYLAPVSVAIAAMVTALRLLSVWVCQRPSLGENVISNKVGTLLK